MRKQSLALAILLAAGSPAMGDTELELLQQQLVQAKHQFDVNPNKQNFARVDELAQRLEQLGFIDSEWNGAQYKSVVGESEPNGTSGTADEIVLNLDSGTGDITPAGDRDFFRTALVPAAAVGDLLFVLHDVDTSDSEMSVFENDGTTLIEFDDDGGDGLGAAVAAVVPTAGSIFAELNEFGDNGTILGYNLFVAAVNPALAMAETEPNDTADFAGSEPLPGLVTTGDLGDTTDDVFHFMATAGDRIGVVVDNDPDTDANFTDAELTLLDTDGTTILASEAPFAAEEQNAVAGTAANTGRHFITVTDGAGADTDYRLIVFVNDVAVTPVDLESFDVE